jgi:hypothetical protein
MISSLDAETDFSRKLLRKINSNWQREENLCTTAVFSKWRWRC